MANWCSNSVVFTGAEENLKKVEDMFREMADEGRRLERGMLPPFSSEDIGYCFDIYLSDGVLYYETKWSPNIQIITAVADHFRLDSFHEFVETGCLVYGEASYQNGVLSEIHLDSEDFDRIDYDEERDLYLFGWEAYESQDELFDILLQEKKKHNDNDRT